MSHTLRMVRGLSEATGDIPVLRTTYYTHVLPGDKRSPYAIMEKYLNNCRAIIFIHLEQNYAAQKDRDLGNIEHHKKWGVEAVSYYPIEDLCSLVASSGVETNPKFRNSLEDTILKRVEGASLVAREVFIDRLFRFKYLEPVTSYCAKQIPLHRKRT